LRRLVSSDLMVPTCSTVSLSYSGHKVRVRNFYPKSTLNSIIWHLLTLLDIMIVSKALLWELKATFRQIACNRTKMAWRTGTTQSRETTGKPKFMASGGAKLNRVCSAILKPVSGCPNYKNKFFFIMFMG
jgi:hypothetical protein